MDQAAAISYFWILGDLAPAPHHWRNIEKMEKRMGAESKREWGRGVIFKP
jgi:hypothetical protein